MLFINQGGLRVSMWLLHRTNVDPIPFVERPRIGSATDAATGLSQLTPQTEKETTLKKKERGSVRSASSKTPQNRILIKVACLFQNRTRAQTMKEEAQQNDFCKKEKEKNDDKLYSQRVVVALA